MLGGFCIWKIKSLNTADLNPCPSGSGGVTNVANFTVPKPLIVVPPKRTLFISRLAYDTTVEDIDYYIKAKLGNNVDITINKFSYSQPRSITSFKIAVAACVYDQIVDTCFWPANIIVREYIFKENPRSKNIARLPPRNSFVSKN